MHGLRSGRFAPLAQERLRPAFLAVRLAAKEAITPVTRSGGTPLIPTGIGHKVQRGDLACGTAACRERAAGKTSATGRKVGEGSGNGPSHELECISFVF